MSKTIFVDADKAQGRAGTVVAAAFLNALNNHRHRGLAIDGDGALDYAADTGAADAYVVALSPALDAYVQGMPVYFKAAHANAGASTLNINGLGLKAIKKAGSLPLTSEDIREGQVVCVIYDGTNFQLITRGLAPHSDSLVNYAVDTGVADAYAVSLTPALEAYTAGIPVFFKACAANTGAATLNVSGLGAQAIKKRGNQDLLAGDILAGQMVAVMFDGINFQLLSFEHTAGLPVGSIIKKLSRKTPPGYYPIEGGTLLRAVDAALFEDLVPQLVAVLQVGAPGLVQIEDHGLAVGDRVRLTTTGTLPTGLAAGTDYYIIAAGLTEDAFQVSAAPGGAAVAFSGAQSGVHTLYCWNVCDPGDGVNTFKLPDVRGEFFRAWDNGRGVDLNRIFGSYQEDDFKSHHHTYVNAVGGPGGLDGGGIGMQAVNTGDTGGLETRPKNRAVRYFIKF